MRLEQHQRPGSGPALLAGLLAALSGVACSPGGESQPRTSTRVARAAIHADVGAGAIPLRDRQGNPIAVGSTTPYSPERTCGTCHDFSLVTQGYHFQQGRGRSNTDLYVADDYDAARPWLLSDGMYGKW